MRRKIQSKLDIETYSNVSFFSSTADASAVSAVVDDRMNGDDDVGRRPKMDIGDGVVADNDEDGLDDGTNAIDDVTATDDAVRNATTAEGENFIFLWVFLVGGLD